MRIPHTTASCGEVRRVSCWVEPLAGALLLALGGLWTATALGSEREAPQATAEATRESDASGGEKDLLDQAEQASEGAVPSPDALTPCSSADQKALQTLMPQIMQAMLEERWSDYMRLLQALLRTVSPSCLAAVAPPAAPGGSSGPMCQGGVCCDSTGCYQ